MKRRYFIIFIALLVVLVALGSFFDFQINNAIFWKDNPISIIFAMIGELPTFIGFSFAAGVIFAQDKKFISNKVLQVCFYLGAIIYICGASYFAGSAFCEPDALGFFIPAVSNEIISTIVGFVLMVPFVILGVLLGKRIDTANKFWSLMLLSFALATTLLINFFTKEFIFCRPRFWYIRDYDHVSLFTNWWDIFSNKDYYMEIDQVDKDAFASFPSGHAAYSAGAVMVFPYLYLISDKLKNKKNLLFFIGVGFTVATSFTRMLCGYHFLSDVAIGMLITTICCFVANEINTHYFNEEEAK